MDFYARYAKICGREGLDPCGQTVAELIGVTRGAISVWNKKGTAPKGETVLAIADALHVSADYLLGRTDDETDYCSPDLTAELNEDVLDTFGGDVHRAIDFQKAVAADAKAEKIAPASFLLKYQRLDVSDRLRLDGYMDSMLTSEKYIQLKKET